jgi:phosphatidylglycerol:prolipoprotein diacylglycerol transferase
MMPVLGAFGPVKIYSFGLMIALGVLLSVRIMENMARRDGFPPSGQDVTDLVFTTVLCGFAGARLTYVIQEWAWYFRHPLEIFAVWEGGLIYYGGAIAALAGLVVFMKLRGIPLLKGFDFIIPGGVITHAFGRVGCFLNGCCYGTPCRFPWAVVFPGTGEAVHPTQLYEALFNLCLFLFLFLRYFRRLFDGEILCLYFVFYGAGRFALEFLREGNPAAFGATWNQWISAAMVLGFLGFYGVLFRRKYGVRHREKTR